MGLIPWEMPSEAPGLCSSPPAARHQHRPAPVRPLSRPLLSSHHALFQLLQHPALLPLHGSSCPEKSSHPCPPPRRLPSLQNFLQEASLQREFLSPVLLPLGQVTLPCGVCPVHCGDLATFTGGQSTHRSAVTLKEVSRHCQTTLEGRVTPK